MIDLTTALVTCCVIQALVIAAGSMTLPALWWLLVRASIKADKDREVIAELRKDLSALDEVVDKVLRGAS